MTQINLLPWREQARQAKKTRFGLVISAVICVALFVILILHLSYDESIRLQTNRITYLQAELNREQSELTKLNKEKKELAKVVTELNYIFSLRNNSYLAVTVLDGIVRAMPEGMTITKLIRRQNTIAISGRSKSSTQITMFMKNLVKLSFFKQPDLTGISGNSSNASDEKDFEIKVELLN